MNKMASVQNHRNAESDLRHSRTRSKPLPPSESSNSSISRSSNRMSSGSEDNGLLYQSSSSSINKMTSSNSRNMMVTSSSRDKLLPSSSRDKLSPSHFYSKITLSNSRNKMPPSDFSNNMASSSSNNKVSPSSFEDKVASSNSRESAESSSSRHKPNSSTSGDKMSSSSNCDHKKRPSTDHRVTVHQHRKKPLVEAVHQRRKKPLLDKNEKKTFVSGCIKYVMFFSNFLFWVGGGFFAGIGLYAYADKGKPVRDGMDVLLDPAIPMIMTGSIMFCVSFLGCTGALRENTVLLKLYAYCMIFIFLAFVVLGALIFILFFSDVRNTSLTPENLLKKAIIKYRDDEDLQDLIDAMQTKFQCCGVSPNGFRDWNLNRYFNCSDSNLSIEKCGVPYSCCRQAENQLINIMCGFDTTNKLELEVRDRIYTDGCYPVIMQWMEANALLFGGIAFGIIVPMLLGIFLSLRLVTQIEDQRDRWKQEKY